jgi:ferric-dicitrate binding protein FerR (iron transport regulator)
MIMPTHNPPPPPEPQTGRSVESAEAWLGRNRSSKRRRWERLNPRHRKELRMLAEALALQQNHARLPEPVRARLDATLAELERLVRRIAAILAEVARRTPPPG